MLTYRILRGLEIEPFIQNLAAFRIEIFKEYPYLYSGNVEYERKYLKEFTKDSAARLLMIFSEKKIIGIFSGVPLSSKVDIVIDLLTAMQEKEPKCFKNFYYYSEMLINSNFRGLGLSHFLFSLMDFEVSSLGFTNACFLTVVRPKNHPLKPINYSDPDIIWNKNGYKKNGASIEYTWPTILANGETKNQKNTLIAWEKPIYITTKFNSTLDITELGKND